MARPKTPNIVLKKRGSNKIREEIDPVSGEVFPIYPLTPEGQRAWHRICAEMEKMGTLSPAYAEFVQIAAGAVGDIEIASRDLIERGHISITERGETKNPSFTIKTSAQTVAHRYLSALGLTPTTIGKLVGSREKDENEFAAL